jgi:hypothetical protein
MRTDDLIASLAADKTVEPGADARAVAVALATTVSFAGVLFFSLAGIRSGLGAWPVTLAVGTKLAITLAAAGIGLSLLRDLVDPVRGESSGIGRLAWLAVLLVVVIALEFWRLGGADWQGRMVGSNGWRCLAMVPLLSILPFAVLMIGLRRGATTRPILGGAVAGMAAAGLGASLYALNCSDDSALFVALWYGAAGAIMTAAGAFCGNAFARW